MASITVTQLAFVSQSLYLISIVRLAVPYFANTSSGGLVLNGVLSIYLNKKVIRFLYSTWLFLSFLSWVPWIYVSGVIKLVCMCICVLLSRYFFVYLRYRSIGRGNGAPGFMVYWLSLYGTLFYITKLFDWDNDVLSFIFLIDFSLIMLSAGLYKVLNGYTSGSGMEYGLCNPSWCYFSNFFQTLFTAARSKKMEGILGVIINYPCFLTEFIIGISIVVHQSRTLGASLLFLTFVLLLIIKLGTLPLTMMAISLSIYIQQTYFAQDLKNLSSYELIFMTYILLLILSYVWVWTFSLNVSLPRQLGRLAKWSYLVTGSIIWSVFTREITKHQLLVLGHPKGQPGPSMIITGLDEGVHSGITRATILTRRSRGLDSEDDQKLRIKLYIKSDIFKSFVVKEIHSYEVTPGGGDHCLTFKAGWKLTENDELESIVNPS